MLKNLKIGVRLAIGFISLLIFLIIITFIGVSSLTHLDENLDLIVKDRMVKTEGANNIIDDVNLVARVIRNMIISDDKKDIEKQWERRKEASKNAKETLEKMKPSIKSEKGKELVREIENARKEYLSTLNKIESFALSGDKKGATELLFGEFRKIQTDYFDSVANLVKYQTELANNDGNSAIKDAESSIRTIYIIAIISIILAFFVALFITTSITKPMKELSDLANDFSQGKLDAKIEVDRKDEAGVLATSFKNMQRVIHFLLKELDKLTKSVTDGMLDVRSNSDKLEGDWKNLIQQVNHLVDAFVKPINVTAEYVDRISKGDIPPKITDAYRGDFNEIKNNLNACIDVMNTLLVETNGLIKATKDGQLDVRAKDSVFNGEWKTLVKGVNELCDAFVKPINVTAEYVDRISKGDIPPRITDNYRGDFNEIKNNLNSCIDIMTSLLVETNGLIKATKEGQLDARAKDSVFTGEWKNLVKGVNELCDAFVKPINVTAEYVDRISKGDIPPKITDVYKGDFNEIKNNLNGCIDSLNGLINEMNHMSVEHDRGDIDVFIDSKKFQNAYKVMAEGINNMVNGHISVKKKAMACVAEFGKGNFDAQIEQFPGKKAFINTTIEAVRVNLKKIEDELSGLIVATKEGQLDKRGNETQFTGGWAKMIKGVNELIDAFVRPINVTAEYVDRISKGDIPPKITDSYKGDFNEIKNNLNMLIEIMNLLLKETGSLIDASKNGNLKKRGNASAFKGEWASIVSGINEMVEAIVIPIQEGVQVIQHIAEGDISHEVKGDYQGDHAILKTAINNTISSLNDLIHQVGVSAEQVLSGSQQVSDSSQSLSQGAAEQASSLEEVSSSVQEISNQTRQSAENANKANEFSIQSRKSAQSGNIQMKNLTTAMNEISDSSKNISKIIKVIDEIAFQTNLLALNAAVEAARAGKHGKGFAVVAEEVRNLAARSAKAAKETSEMIEEAIKKAEKGSDLANQTASVLNEIESGANKLTDIIKDMADAATQQAGAISEINTSLMQIEQVTQQNTANAEESAAASEELSGQARELKHMLDKFVLKNKFVSHSKSAIQDKKRPPLNTPKKNNQVVRPQDVVVLDDDFGKY
ncbi:MCP four helix bundle domain-containing protein [bacterium]|nr:MCP four helix bundle domain-containing protein [bacterium]